MNPTQTVTVIEVCARLKALNWQQERTYYPAIEFISRDYQYQILIDSTGQWTLGKFTDSDVDGVARGRYETVQEGDDLAELLEVC